MVGRVYRQAEARRTFWLMLSWELEGSVRQRVIGGRVATQNLIKLYITGMQLKVSIRPGRVNFRL
jgi:hypothetical protein